MFKLVSALLAAAIFPVAVLSFDSYPNEFVNSTYLVSKNYPATSVVAQNTIVSWADQFAGLGPWSVMEKSGVAPNGDKHTYLSWAPYWWPNCTGVGNTTELTPEQIWVTCPYYQRDGMFNPDRLLVNDTGNWNAMADAVFYNSMAWLINGSDVYENNVVNFISTWFLNPDTFMQPNLEYAQMDRGPDGQVGAHTGLLDGKCMAKVATGIQILRDAKSTVWTSDLDAKMVNWTNTYITWVTTAKIALEEKAATNNHGSFYYNQLASLYIIVGDDANAKSTLQEYFEGIYQNQIDANGEQPFEMIRTHPYHYRCYNLAAIMVNAQLASYVGYDAWNVPTKNGGNIQKALDFTMAVPPGDEPAGELYYLVATIGAIYGDPAGKYAAFLKNAEVTYPSEPYFLWTQPLSDSGWVASNLPATNSNSNGSSGNGSGSGSTNHTGGAVGVRFSGLIVTLVSAVGVSALLFV